jgi:uncharacterized protein (DUF433 family)
MQLEDYLDRVSPDVIRLKGHRIGIEDVIARYHTGASMEHMALEFPGVPLEQLYATIAYYLHHRDAVDAYIARVNAAYRARMQAQDAQPASPLMQRLRALRAQQEHQAA